MTHCNQCCDLDVCFSCLLLSCEHERRVAEVGEINDSQLIIAVLRLVLYIITCYDSWSEYQGLVYNGGNKPLIRGQYKCCGWPPPWKYSILFINLLSSAPRQTAVQNKLTLKHFYEFGYFVEVQATNEMTIQVVGDQSNT